MQQQVTRRLAAILAVDVVGYSGMAAQDEPDTRRRLEADVAELFAPRIERFQGHLCKTAGPDLLVAFSTIVGAVRCAVEVQGEAAGRGAAAAGERRLLYRIGINLGDVVFENDGISGKDVDLAVQIGRLAAPGGIALSLDAYFRVRRKLKLEFEDLGEFSPEDLDEPVRLFGIVLPAGAGPETAGSARVTAAAAPSQGDWPSILVLPFENMSGDPEHEYLCDGITLDLITDLAKVSDLRVHASNTSFLYKERRKDILEIGGEQQVRYVLDGSIHRSRAKARIDAQLIDARSGHHLWTDRFSFPWNADDIFAAQDAITRKVVSSISARVGLAERTVAVRKDAASATAYDAFLRGTYHWWQFLNIDESRESWKQSCDWFRQACGLDPLYARSLAWLAYARVEGYRRGWGDDQWLEDAEAEAQRAVHLERSEYDTHWALAYCNLIQRKFDQALGHYHRAFRLNRNDPDLIIEMAEAFTYRGEHDEALTRLQRSLDLNPQYADYCGASMGWVLYFLGRYEDSIRQLTALSYLTGDSLKALAASHAQRAVTQDGASSARETAAAEWFMRDFLESNPGWTAARERERLIFRNAADEDHWLDGLRRAGLPDG